MLFLLSYFGRSVLLGATFPYSDHQFATKNLGSHSGKVLPDVLSGESIEVLFFVFRG